MNKTYYIVTTSLTINTNGETLTFTISSSNPTDPNSPSYSADNIPFSIQNPTEDDKSKWVYGARLDMTLTPHVES